MNRPEASNAASGAGEAVQGGVQRLVVAYNSAQALHAQARHSSAAPVLLVDNASSDDTATVAEALGHTVLRLERNVGYGPAIMAGLAMLDAECVLVVNPDVQIPEGCGEALMAAANRWPDCDIFVPNLQTPDGARFYRHESAFEPRVRDRSLPDGDCCVPALSGAALLLRRQAFLDWGGFDPSIFLFFEDDDLALRCQRERRPVIYVHGARAIHEGDASTAGDAGAHRIKDTNFGWSQLYVGAKHFYRSGYGTVLGMMVSLLRYAVQGRRQRLSRTLGRLSGAWGYLRGKPAPGGGFQGL